MTQINGNDTDTAQRYETPTFDPRGAFARTLRSGEIARRERERKIESARRYETPTFDPRGAFARTLRSGEIARRERQVRLPDPRQLGILAVVA